jgi:hypothetical protein
MKSYSLAIAASGVVVIVGLISSCASTRSPIGSRNEYVPNVEIIPSGFRPQLPVSSPEVTYQWIQYLSVDQVSDIHRNFVEPLINGPYGSHIDSIVIYGSGEAVSTRFRIWLHDGRNLDSGRLFFDDKDLIVPGFSNNNLGKPMHRHATSMLRKAIPDPILDRDKQAQILAAGQGR